MGKIVDFLRFIYTREVPANPMTWHRRNMFLSVRCTDGKLALRVWRRKTLNGQWEYKPREETFEEWTHRQL
jgi:hypothetical protein